MFRAKDSKGLTEQDLEIFAATIPDDHYLRRVKAAVDFERFRSQLTGLYDPSLGRPALDPVLMVKLEFLQIQYGLSDRSVIDQCRVNLAYRFFLDLGLHTPLPDPSSLTYFRNRLGPEAHQQLFHDIVAQAREHGFIKDRLRLKDATHVIANIAVPSTLALVATTRDHLLDAARPYEPQRVAQEGVEIERLRTATADLPDQARLVHRVNHLRAIVTWADELMLRLEQSGCPEDQAHARLGQALALAHKVLHDRDNPKAPDKLLSVEDPDARTGWHHQWFVGYCLDITEDADSEFVTAIDLLSPSGDEAANATALITQEEQAHGNDVETLSIDGIGFRGDLLEQWTDANGLGLEVIVPPSEHPPAKGFPPDQFVLNADQNELTCPAGKTTSRRERNANDTGWKYRFNATQCGDCPLRAQCLANPEKSGTARTVIKNDYDAVYRAAREKAETARYGEVRAQHPRVERKLGELARWHGARHARYRGRAKVLIQMLLTGVVVNVKRLVKLLEAEVAPRVGIARAACAGR
jgi:transposase